MGRRQFTCLWLLLGLFAFFFTLVPAMAAIKETSTLVGRETWNFNLASTQDRLINYGDEYYGKYTT